MWDLFFTIYRLSAMLNIFVYLPASATISFIPFYSFLFASKPSESLIKIELDYQRGKCGVGQPLYVCLFLLVFSGGEQ